MVKIGGGGDYMENLKLARQIDEQMTKKLHIITKTKRQQTDTTKDHKFDTGLYMYCLNIFRLSVLYFSGFFLFWS